MRGERNNINLPRAEDGGESRVIPFQWLTLFTCMNANMRGTPYLSCLARGILEGEREVGEALVVVPGPTTRWDQVTLANVVYSHGAEARRRPRPSPLLLPLLLTTSHSVHRKALRSKWNHVVALHLKELWQLLSVLSGDLYLCEACVYFFFLLGFLIYATEPLYCIPMKISSIVLQQPESNGYLTLST